MARRTISTTNLALEIGETIRILALPAVGLRARLGDLSARKGIEDLLRGFRSEILLQNE